MNRIPLIWRIVLAIAFGVFVGWLLPLPVMRVLKTFNVLFAQLLKFIVPLLLLGLVTPAIASAGKGAGKMLALVMGLSYVSTCCAALFGYGCATRLLPLYVPEGAIAAAVEGVKILPFVELKIPPVCDVLTALALSFMVGIGCIVTGAERVRLAFVEFGGIVTLTIQRVIIPGIPIYILTMIAEMTASGRIGAMAGTMVKVIGTGWALTIVFLVILYVLAGAIARKNPLAALANMTPAYLTALSVASSSAVIPVTLDCCRKNGISDETTNFTIPLCANVHMVGSAIKMMVSLWAVAIIYSLDISFAQIVQFCLLFAIAAVAAPGVMSGVLMASLGFVETIIGFNADQLAVMMTFYMALDGYGPAANVTGDGAIALIVDAFRRR